MPPRICIDCSPLLVRSAGVKTYLHHWLAALRAMHPERIQTFLEPPGKTLDHGGGPGVHPARLAALQLVNRLPSACTALFMQKPEILHISNLLRNCLQAPIVSATIHDLTAWITPQFHRTAQVTADKAFASRVGRHARGLIAVSENTRQDAIRLLGTAEQSIRVIYPGVPDSYFSPNPAEASRASQTLGLTTPYFLFTSTIEPRKNVDTLLDAWASLPPAFHRDNQLVLAGMPGWNSGGTMRRLAQLARERSGVRYLGYVPEGLLPGLTAGAQALLYPSYYEGFGLPVAQAMAAGCPVVTSHVSCLPEVAGGAALLIDPASESDLAFAIRNVRESASLRERLVDAGRKRAQAFTWRKAAELSFQYFNDLAG